MTHPLIQRPLLVIFIPSPSTPLLGNIYIKLDYDDYGRNYTVTSVVSDVYDFEAGEFLHPLEYTPSEFLSEWNRYLEWNVIPPCLLTCCRFSVGFVLDVVFDSSLDQKEMLFEKLAASAASFHRVLNWSYSEQYFQLAYPPFFFSFSPLYVH